VCRAHFRHGVELSIILCAARACVCVCHVRMTRWGGCGDVGGVESCYKYNGMNVQPSGVHHATSVGVMHLPTRLRRTHNNVTYDKVSPRNDSVARSSRCTITSSWRWASRQLPTASASFTAGNAVLPYELCRDGVNTTYKGEKRTKTARQKQKHENSEGL